MNTYPEPLQLIYPSITLSIFTSLIAFASDQGTLGRGSLELQNHRRSRSEYLVSTKMAGVYMWKLVFFGVFTASVAVLIAWYMRESFDPESLRGKKVVICGASTGIGEELAYQYAKFGAQVLLVARREAVLQKVVARCGELGAQTASYVVADLSSLEGAKHLAAVSFI